MCQNENFSGRAKTFSGRLANDWRWPVVSISVRDNRGDTGILIFSRLDLSGMSPQSPPRTPPEEIAIPFFPTN